MPLFEVMHSTRERERERDKRDAVVSLIDMCYSLIDLPSYMMMTTPLTSVSFDIDLKRALASDVNFCQNK